MRGGDGNSERVGRRKIYSRSAFIASAIVACNVAHAATTPATWTGGTSTDFEDPGNWVNGTGGTGTGSTGSATPTAPAPKNSADTAGTSGDIAVFTGATPTSNMPTITATRSIQGLLFSTPTGGWTLSGNSGAILTVGGNGISTVGQTSGIDTVSASLAFNNTGSLLAGTGGILSLTGAITVGTSLAPLTISTEIGGSGATGTVILDPGSNSDNFYGGNTNPTVAVFNGVLQLGTASTTTTSIMSTTNTAVGGLATANPLGKIVIAGGTWETNDLGGSTNAYGSGTVEISAGTLAAGGARGATNYSATQGGRIVVDGGNFIVTGGGNTGTNDTALEIGETGAAITANRTASLDVTSGLVDVARSSIGSQIGNNGSAGSLISTALINQDGGVVRFGVTAATNVFTQVASGSATTTNLVIGAAKVNSGNAYTLTGGKLLFNGIISGGAVTATQIDNFNFMGGQLSIGTFNATNLTSNNAATFSGSGTLSSGTGQASVGTNLGILENYGGTLAPGDVGTAGRTVILGGYAGNGGNSAMAFDLGGTTPANGFQIASSGDYDLLTATTGISLNDKLLVSFINNFTPTSSQTFTIITTSAGTAITGAFSNLSSGIGVTTDGSYDYTVTNSGTSIVLSNFTAVPEPTSCGVIAFATGLLIRRRRRTTVR